METVVIVGGMNHIIPKLNADYIGVDAGLAHCLDQGIRPIIAIGDFDSIKIEKDMKIPLIRYSDIKDETDLELAINYAKERYSNIIVCNCLGGRIDHQLYNIKLLIENPEIIILDQNQKIFVLEKGRHMIENTHHYFSFFAVKPSKLSLIGFKYTVKNEEFSSKDFRTISNEIILNQGVVDIEYGKILCVQSD